MSRLTSRLLTVAVRELSAGMAGGVAAVLLVLGAGARWLAGRRSSAARWPKE